MAWREFPQKDALRQGDVFHIWLGGRKPPVGTEIDDEFLHGLRIMAEATGCDAFCLGLRRSDQKTAVFFKKFHGASPTVTDPHRSMQWSRFFVKLPDGPDAVHPVGSLPVAALNSPEVPTSARLSDISVGGSTSLVAPIAIRDRSRSPCRRGRDGA